MSTDPSTKTRIACPQCGRHLMVPNSALGKTGKCPGCEHRFPLQASPSMAAPPVIQQPPGGGAATSLGNASADPFGSSSAYGQGVQPMGLSPLGAPQPQLGAPQPFGQQQHFGQQPYGQGPAGGYAPAPAAYQQPHPSQWGSANPYAAPTVTQQAKQRAKRSGSGDNTPAGEIAGGVMMMLGAVVWFVLGWMAGRIFFYPPILFIIGACSLVKGIADLGR